MPAIRAALLSLLLALPAHAQDATTVTLTAPGVETVALTPESLAAMPMLDQQISFQSAKGPESAIYRGVLLWYVLSTSTSVEDDVKSSLRQTVLVSARDGHQVAFSVGEIAPEFGNTPVMLAVEQDGKPMADGLRVVVPGDTRGARNIRDVTAIELH